MYRPAGRRGDHRAAAIVPLGDDHGRDGLASALGGGGEAVREIGRRAVSSS